MENKLSSIAVKPNDYFFCENCGRINWYENTECVACEFPFIFEEIVLCGNEIAYPKFCSWIESEYNYWINQEGYTEEEADEVRLEV